MQDKLFIIRGMKKNTMNNNMYFRIDSENEQINACSSESISKAQDLDHLHGRI